MRNILIFGKNGQLAKALARSLRAEGTAHTCLGSDDLDLTTSLDAVSDIIGEGGWTGIINATAYSNVDGAETDLKSAFHLNAIAPAHMAEVCVSVGLPFLHVSTDYVFGGRSKEPYLPSDKFNPLNVYGESKAGGETGILEHGGQSAIVRTSWLYDGQGRNFLTTMMKMAETGDEISVVDDQVGRPTYAGHLAQACLKIIGSPPKSPKIYHVQNSGDPVSWHGFAKEIFSRSGRDVELSAVTTDAFPRPAKRPAYSVLNISDFERDYAHPMQSWQDGLELALNEYQSCRRRS